MRRLVSLLPAKKANLDNTKWYTKQVKYFLIINLFEKEQKLQDITKILIHRYVNDFNYKSKSTAPL